MTTGILAENALKTENALDAGLAIGFAGWKGCFWADSRAAQKRLAWEYARYVIAPSPEIVSGVRILDSDSPRPRIQIICRGAVCEFSQMLAGPEWKRFAAVPDAAPQTYADTIFGSAPALEADGGNIVVLQPEKWPLYAYLAAMWLMLHEHPMIGLHAAVSAASGRALALIGPSGSGKSTLSWALQQSGANYFGDDWVFFTLPNYLLHIGHQDLCMRPGGVAALSLPTDALDWYEAKPNDVKCNVALPESVRPCPPNRVALLFMDGFCAEPSLRPVGGGEAARRLLKHLSCGDPSPIARLGIAAGLVNRYPCFALSVGPPKATAALLMAYAAKGAA